MLKCSWETTSRAILDIGTHARMSSIPVLAKIRIKHTDTIIVIIIHSLKSTLKIQAEPKCAGIAEEWVKEKGNHNFHPNKSHNMECWSYVTQEMF